MTIPIYQVDAFTLGPFSGNPAAVCPLDAWLDDDTMQSIAAENNLAETAFIVAREDGYDLRWFTPLVEVDLCGHATLAAGYVVLNHLRTDLNSVSFETISGELIVTREGGRLSMDFPARVPLPAPVSEALSDALGQAPAEVHLSRDILAVYDDEASVRRLSPDQDKFRVAILRPQSRDRRRPGYRLSALYAGAVLDGEARPVTTCCASGLSTWWRTAL